MTMTLCVFPAARTRARARRAPRARSAASSRTGAPHPAAPRAPESGSADTAFDPGLAAANDLFDAARAELSDAGLLNVRTISGRPLTPLMTPQTAMPRARQRAAICCALLRIRPASTSSRGIGGSFVFSSQNPANIPVCKFIIAYLLDRCHTILRRTPRKGIPRPDVTNM